MPEIIVVGARGIPNMEGGAEKNAEKVFPRIVAAGPTVELLGISKFIDRPEFQGVRLTGIPTVNFLKTDKVLYNFLAFLHAAVKRPKIVHMQCLSAALFLLLYKLVGLRVVVRYGSTDYELQKWGMVERWALHMCEYQMRFADHVIAVSETFRRHLIDRHGLKRISVVPNGLDPVEVSDEARAFKTELGLDGKRYVLAVGRVTQQKDFETLVQAVRGLDDPDSQLIVVGGAESEYGERLFAQNDERVRFIGRIDRSLISALYQDCSVYVNSSRHEGLSNAVLEALSYSCPLIVSDIPANAEMGLPAANYFTVGDVEGLRGKISAALATPEAFRCPTEQFAQWSDVCERTLEVYRDIMPDQRIRTVDGRDAAETN